METYKEEKSLKESVFLKNIKKQIQDIKDIVTVNDESGSGSDSQAEQLMISQHKMQDAFYKTEEMF